MTKKKNNKNNFKPLIKAVKSPKKNKIHKKSPKKQKIYKNLQRKK